MKSSKSVLALPSFRFRTPKSDRLLGLTDKDELKGFARTIAEIERLLLILVLVYLVAVEPQAESNIAIHMALFFLGAFILRLHYAHFYKAEQTVRLTLGTWVMIVFITWVTWYSGKIDSPLISLHLLPIIASALILGKAMTTIATVAVIVSYMAMAYATSKEGIASLSYWGVILTLIAPVVLVSYITTMLSADIRFALAKIKRVSETDELTGVYNMRAFTAILKRCVQQSIRHSHPLSIVMVDADNLKSVNDAYGHDAGDKLLKHLISKFIDELRQSDILARYGGDEFTVLLPETDLSGATEVAERMRKSVEDSRFRVRGNMDLTTTISHGIASHPEHGGNSDVIVEKADKALYRAKREGRNRIALYELEKDAGE
jgi:diguanylate cyclase (GGDEF)-like protein